jgi:hypothetical protein
MAGKDREPDAAVEETAAPERARTPDQFTGGTGYSDEELAAAREAHGNATT